MAILGNWVNRTGVRHTTPGTVHELCVKVDAHAKVDRVEFALTVNGSPGATLTATEASIRTPNFSAVDSPLPGVGSGMASFTGWGVGLDLSTVAAGTIVVTATVVDTDENSRVLPDTITIYNDTDGTDRRPRAVTLYADGDAGNDANDGTSWGQAVKTIMRARQLGRSGAGDVSGLRIICRGTFVDLAGGIFPECTTSGDWHCEHVADAAGAYLNPPGDPLPIGARTIYGGATGASSATVTCRTRWTGFRISGTGIVSYSFGGILEHWFEGCSSEGTNWSEGRLSVRYAEPAVGGSGSVIGWNGPGPAGRRYFTGCTIRGAVLGFEQSRLTYDCLVRDFTGIACKVGSAASPSVVGALLMQSERYYPREVEGFVRMDSDPVQGQGRPALVVTKPTGTTARITGPVGGYDFSIDAAELVGTTYWGLRFEGSGATGLDTGVGLLVTAVGNTGGAPWVEVTAPGASAGSISANTCSFYTARVSSGVNYWNIHPDGIQIERALVQGDVIFDCAIVDAPNLQSYFTSGNDIDKALIDNLRDDGSGENAGNWNGTDCTDSILQRLTLRGQFQNSGGAGGWSGTYVRNCVFGSLGGDASSIGSRGGTVTNCHVISGSAFGTSGTTGAWFDGDESADPWPFAPAVGNRGTGAAAVSDPPEWAYSESGSTRGVLKNVGDLDWSLPGGPVDPPVTVITYDHSAHPSVRYTATVQGEPLPLCGRTTDTQFNTPYWSSGQMVDQSWATVATDGDVEIVVSLISGPITNAKVYTRHPSLGKLIPSTVAGGTLSFTLPYDTTAWCEIEGVRGQPLIIHSKPIIEQPTGPTVDLYNGTQTAAVAGRTLVFEAGTHTIGQSFQVPAGARVWLHGEAWVIGSFRAVNNAGDHGIDGHGVLSGEWGSAIRAYIRTLPFEEAITYSLIHGPYIASSHSKVSGITLLDSPFYSTSYGFDQYERVTVVGPWWGNANGFFLAQKWPELTGSVHKCCAFVHDDIFDLAEYYGPHTFTENVIGSIASASFIVSYWPFEDSGTSHFADENTVVCLNYAGETSGVGAIVLAWSDGSSPSQVVDGILIEDCDFVGNPINGRPFDISNRLYPIEWGPQASAMGQIQNFTFRRITFESVPLRKSIIKGLDANNRPRNIVFEEVWYAATRLTAANFRDYFEIDEFATNITVDGVRVDMIQTTGDATVEVGASGTSGLQIVSVGGASVSISAAGAAALQVGAVGTATVPIAASGFSTVSVVPPAVPPAPTNAPRGPGVAPSTRLRRRAWWTWLSPW